MQFTEKQKKIALLVVGVLLVLLIVLFFLIKGNNKGYVITFDSKGGSNVNSLYVKKGEKITKPEDPTKEGFLFTGWYYEEELFDSTSSITKNMTLEAGWKEEGKVEGIQLDLKELALKPGDTHTLIATVLPENAKNKNIQWKSSDESIVSVDDKGNLVAKKEGKATITVTSEDGNYEATCTVEVTKDIVTVTGVSIEGKSEVTVGQTITLSAVIKPENASNKAVKWSSSNTSIATVDQNGVVKALKAGKVKITVKTDDGSKSATKEITVKGQTSTQPSQTPSETTPEPKPEEKPQETNVPVLSARILGEQTRTVYIGDTLDLTVEINPTNATNQTVRWSSSRSEVASVENGHAVTKSAGTTTITVTSEDGNKTSSITVVVQEKPATYALYLKPFYQSGTNNVKQYTYRITKNNETFTDYVAFIYNGKTTRKNAGTIDVNALGDKSAKTATLYLDENTTVTIAVYYEE